MPSYLAMCNWTEQGVKTVKDSPARLEAAKEAAKAANSRIVFFYMLMGEYDFAVLLEAPDDATASKFLLTLGAAGNLRSTTMKAFTEDEYRAILGSL
jgi:uncharacterized protein with GYD domain